MVNLFFIERGFSQSLGYDFGYKDAKKTTDEFSLSAGQLNFNNEWKARAFFQLEIMERDEKYGFGLGLGWTNIDSKRFTENLINYKESVDFIPVELNGKRFFQLNNLEFGIGIGVSMNFFNYQLDNVDINKNLESKTRVLFGAQGMGEFKILFPSSYGKNAFVGLEGKYQWVDKANTFLDHRELSNYRLIIKLGGIF